MRLKTVLLISLVLLLASCATFRPLPTTYVTINGVFKVNYEGNVYDGFFSWSDGNLRMDVVNSFGFSMYGIYVKNGDVFVKDYQTGKIYRNLKAGDLDFSSLKGTIVDLTKNFTRLCGISISSVVVLRCEQVGKFKLPDELILKSGNKRLRLSLTNLKVLEANR